MRRLLPDSCSRRSPKLSLIHISEPTVEALGAAFAGPMIGALAAGGGDLAVLRIVARVGVDPPQGWDRLSERFDRIRAEALPVLKANLPGVEDQELIFRMRCVAGLLNWLVLAPLGTELRDKSAKQIERLLVPVLAGALRGTSSI